MNIVLPTKPLCIQIKNEIIRVLTDYSAALSTIGQDDLIYEVLDSWVGEQKYESSQRVINVFLETVENSTSSYTTVMEKYTYRLLLLVKQVLGNQGDYYHAANDNMYMLAEQVRLVLWGNTVEHSFRNRLSSELRGLVSQFDSKFNVKSLQRDVWLKGSDYWIVGGVDYTLIVNTTEYQSSYYTGNSINYNQIVKE